MLGLSLDSLLGAVTKTVIDRIATRENYTDLMDDLLDMFERWAAKTNNKLDDHAVAALRRMLDIPDGDD